MISILNPGLTDRAFAELTISLDQSLVNGYMVGLIIDQPTILYGTRKYCCQAASTKRSVLSQLLTQNLLVTLVE